MATSNENDDDYTTSPLGDLSKITLELRHLVYNYWIDDNHTRIRFYQGTLLVAQPTHTPGLLETSKVIQDEVVRSAMAQRICEVDISQLFLSTNFPLYAFLETSKTNKRKATALSLPRCKEVLLRVHIPDPRSSSSSSEIRYNVAEVVRLLNASGQAIPNTFHVMLMLKGQPSHDIPYSDFSMLLGPLGQLQRLTKGLRILSAGHEPTKSLDARCQEQIELIEAAANGIGDPSQELRRQQLLIDIKLELAFSQIVKYHGRYSGTPYYRPALRAALESLLKLRREIGFSEDWVEERWVVLLLDTVSAEDGNNVLTEDHYRAAFGDHDPVRLHYWAAGHLTSANPFW